VGRVARATLSPPAADDADVVLLRTVRRARDGPEPGAGFRAIEASLAPRLRRYFHHQSFSPQDAEDLVQEVLVRTWRGLPRLQQEERFVHWLFVIAGNVSRTARARRRRETRFVVEGTALAQEAADRRAASSYKGDGYTLRDALRDAANELPDAQRQCLLLRVRDELSYEEIAATLRLSVYTVRNHLAAAKKTLRAHCSSRRYPGMSSGGSPPGAPSRPEPASPVTASGGSRRTSSPAAWPRCSPGR
jgi:RNA polymerase sigma-70 factor (ECF subfamily)